MDTFQMKNWLQKTVTRVRNCNHGSYPLLTWPKSYSTPFHPMVYHHVPYKQDAINLVQISQFWANET